MTDNLDNPIADIEKILDRDNATEDRLVKASGLLYNDNTNTIPKKEPWDWFLRIWNELKDFYDKKEASESRRGNVGEAEPPPASGRKDAP